MMATQFTWPAFFFSPSYLSNEFIGISYVELQGKPFSDLSVLYAFITFISYVKRYAKEGYYNVWRDLFLINSHLPLTLLDTFLLSVHIWTLLIICSAKDF